MRFKPTKMLIDIPSSTSAAWFDFIKMFVGIGILVIPNAFVNGGLALTSVFLVLITLTFTHGMMQVVSCLILLSPNIQFIKKQVVCTQR